MVTIMHLDEKPFNDFENGNKTREYRIFDEKRRQLQLGDTIEFIKRPDMIKKLRMEIVGLLIYKDFYTMYEDFFEQEFKERYKNVQEVVDDTFNDFYTKEEEQENGVIAIKVKKINN